MPARQQIHEPETRVVAGDQVFGTRVAQAYDYAQR
jgi:hypothetical protein